MTILSWFRKKNQKKKKIGGEEEAEDGLQDVAWQHVSTVCCIHLHMGWRGDGLGIRVGGMVGLFL